MARPREYDKESVMGEILPLLRQATPLAKVLRDNPHLPDHDTIRGWMVADPSLTSDIALAREDGGDKIAADCLVIADSDALDMVAVQKQKLRIETRLKLLSKWHPKRYGDKLEVSGGININIETPLAQLRKLAGERELLPSNDAQSSQVIEAEVVVDIGEAECF